MPKVEEQVGEGVKVVGGVDEPLVLEEFELIQKLEVELDVGGVGRLHQVFLQEGADGGLFTIHQELYPFPPSFP